MFFSRSSRLQYILRAKEGIRREVHRCIDRSDLLSSAAIRAKKCPGFPGLGIYCRLRFWSLGSSPSLKPLVFAPADGGP